MKQKIRKRFYIAVEGEGEQSFIKWLQELADKCELFIHLDCQIIKGGGYKTMLHQTVKCRKYKQDKKASILLVDKDRSKETMMVGH